MALAWAHSAVTGMHGPHGRHYAVHSTCSPDATGCLPREHQRSLLLRTSCIKYLHPWSALHARRPHAFLGLRLTPPPQPRPRQCGVRVPPTDRVPVSLARRWTTLAGSRRYSPPTGASWGRRTSPGSSLPCRRRCGARRRRRGRRRRRRRGRRGRGQGRQRGPRGLVRRGRQ